MTATVVPMARAAAVLAAAGLVLAACSASPKTTGDAAETDAPSAAATAAGPETRQVILDLALPTYDGGQFDPNTLKAKPVILWFWGAF